MNNIRRKQLQEISERVSTLLDQLRDCKDELEQIREDEQEAYDNLPESIQDGDRGQAMQNSIDAIESACDTLMGYEDLDISSDIENAVA